MQGSEAFAVLAIDSRTRTTQQFDDIYVHLFAVLFSVIRAVYILGIFVGRATAINSHMKSRYPSV
jgi:hypothetical protein